MKTAWRPYDRPVIMFVPVPVTDDFAIFATGGEPFRSIILGHIDYCPHDDHTYDCIEIDCKISIHKIATFSTIQLTDPIVVAGLIIGGSLPFFFTSYLMNAVGKAASAIVEEVRAHRLLPP